MPFVPDNTNEPDPTTDDDLAQKLKEIDAMYDELHQALEQKQPEPPVRHVLPAEDVQHIVDATYEPSVFDEIFSHS